MRRFFITIFRTLRTHLIGGVVFTSQHVKVKRKDGFFADRLLLKTKPGQSYNFIRTLQGKEDFDERTAKSRFCVFGRKCT